MNFLDYLSAIDPRLKARQAAKLKKFADLLLAKNRDVNLTAPMHHEQFYVKHLIDSLLILKFVPDLDGRLILDLGTGGGLPGIPLAITNPDAQFTLVDATQKKVAAIDEFVKALKLTNVKTIAARAEELGRDPAHREHYDLVLSRALAPLNVLLEYTMPLVHLNGAAICYKGPEYLSELSQAQSAMGALQIDNPTVKRYTLPEDFGERSLLIFKKKTQTPSGYPRDNGMPSKKPL